MSYFSREELKCKHTGEYFFDEDFLGRLNAIREEYGRPMIVTSGYRSPEHPVEKDKVLPGAHTEGLAVDIRANSEEAFWITSIALKHGIKRIGIHEDFVHLDASIDRPSPRLWTY